MNDSDDIVKEFLVESYENLDRLDRDLVTLEKEPSNREILASIFRTIHTIKGTSGFLGFDKLGAVAHVGESLLGLLRDGEKALDRDITSALLAMVDAIRQMLGNIETTGAEGERDDGGLISRLVRLQGAQEEAEDDLARAEGVAAAPPTDVPEAGAAETGGAERGVAVAGGPSSGVPEIPVAMIENKPAGLASGPEPETKHPIDAVETQRAQPGGVNPAAADRTIRLDVALLDHLMNLVGELVLARNQVLQYANRAEDSVLAAASQRLDLITTELQEGVMKTRMQPIGNIWSKLPRTVRDLALACGKRVRVEMEGNETELDKTLVEAIKDPLTHIVRNSVDHGIERPEARQAVGKDPEGRLFLRAFHEGGQVNIEISDDGAGLDPERIRKKAVERGLVSADHAGRLSEREMVNLVFLPGFSTAEKVTNVSGRGVGMDVVKTHIEKIGGAVELQSKSGEGVMVRMKIPLTLAIIPALIVTSGRERYAVPQVSLLELVGMTAEQAAKAIESIHGAPVYRLRGRLLPLVYLRSVLRTDVAAGAAPEGVNIAVLEAEGRQFGLAVDEINDTEEIVVKPLDRHLKNLSVYAGAAIMGDGKVALILDVLGLAQRSKIVSEGRERLTGEEAAAAAGGAKRKRNLVLFTGRGGARMAVPLELLARLENIPGSEVERSGSQWVTQYRGQILPLIRVTHALEERRRNSPGADLLPLPTTDELQVLVLEHEKQSFGLVVNQILDIVESTLEPRSPATRAGVLHGSVIAERVTELLDVPYLLRAGEAYDPLETLAGGQRGMNQGAEPMNEANRSEN